jgi:type III secretion protein F
MFSTSSGVTPVYGLDIAALFQRTLHSIEVRGQDLYRDITKLTEVKTDNASNTTTSSISQEQMLVIQFEIGQYNAMVEMLSSVSKSLVDMMKTLAQCSS